MARILACALLAVVGCSEPTLNTADAPPSVSILSPEAESSFAATDLLELVALVSDDAGPDSLELTWSSTAGILGVSTADVDGNVFLAVSGSAFPAGANVITLTAVDSGGNQATDAVNVVVGDLVGTTVPAGAPSITLSAPTNGQTYVRDDIVNVVAIVSDAEQTPDTLSTSITSSVHGLLWEGSPSATGTVSESFDVFDVGSHSITFSALDASGLVTTAMASFEVLNDGRPYATISAPIAGTSFGNDESITFEGTISDDEDDAEDLLYYWSSDIDGMLNSGSPNSNGYTAFGGMLSGGTHLITFTAVDTEAREASDSILLYITDPNDRDLDGDGYTVNDGDCDDDDINVNPGATEVCDDVDNNCDGIINENAWDPYETDQYGAWSPNDSHDQTYYVGEIDINLGWGAQMDLTGLTLHSADDSDWFGWFADDNPLDNATPTITATMPATGDWTLELYKVRNGNWGDWGAYDIIQTATGNTSIMVDCWSSGFPFFSGPCELLDDDDDYFAVHVYSTGWAPAACSAYYDLNIHE